MAFIPIPHTAKVIMTIGVTGEGADLNAHNTLYFTRQDFTSEDLESLLTDLSTGFCADLVTQMNSTYTIETLTGYDMRTIDGYKRVLAVNEVGLAAASGGPVSPAMSLVLTFYGDRRGRWNSGRNFLPGLSEGHIDVDNIHTDFSTNAIGAYTNLITVPPVGWQWVIASTHYNKAARLEGVTTPVSSVVVRNLQFGFQRRRATRL